MQHVCMHKNDKQILTYFDNVMQWTIAIDDRNKARYSAFHIRN